jgi:hypothetical protein
MSDILKYAEVPPFDYISVTDWVPVADGVERDIGIVIRIGRGDILLAHTPTIYDDPDDFTQYKYSSGNIFMITGNSIVWIKPRLVNFPVSARGEVLYNVQSHMIAITATTNVTITPS